MQRSQFSKFAFLLVVLLLCFPGCTSYWSCGKNITVESSDNSGKEEKPITFPDEKAAAEDGLKTFAGLVGAENFKDMGFQSKEEIGTATLGEPLKVFLLKSDSLRDYKGNVPPDGLLTDINRSIYPVMAGGQVRSSIIVEKQDGGWSAVSFGDSGLVRKLVQESKRFGEDFTETSPPQPRIVIHAAFIDLYFVGLKAGGTTLHVRNATLYHEAFPREGMLPATVAFERLAPIAREHTSDVGAN